MKKEDTFELIQKFIHEAERIWPYFAENYKPYDVFMASSSSQIQRKRTLRQQYIDHRMKGRSHRVAQVLVELKDFFSSNLTKDLALYGSASAIVLGVLFAPNLMGKKTHSKNVVPPEVLTLWEQKNRERKTGTHVIPLDVLEDYEDKHAVRKNEKGTTYYSTRWLQDITDEKKYEKNHAGKMPNRIFRRQIQEERERAIRHHMMQMIHQ